MCNRVNLNIVYNLCILLVALANAIIPHQRSIVFLGACFFLNGLAGGTIESASIARILTLWGKKSGVFLQALDCMYGLGAVIAPFASQPFLIEMKIIQVPDIPEVDLVFSDYNSTTEVTWTTSTSEPVNETSTKLIFIDEFTNQTVTPDHLKLVYPYSTVSLFAGFILFVSLILFCIEGHDKAHPSRGKDGQCDSPQSVPEIVQTYTAKCEENYRPSEVVNGLNKQISSKINSPSTKDFIGVNNQVKRSFLVNGSSSGIDLSKKYPQDELKDVPSNKSTIDSVQSSSTIYGSICNDSNGQRETPGSICDGKKFQILHLTPLTDKSINNNDLKLLQSTESSLDDGNSDERNKVSSSKIIKSSTTKGATNSLSDGNQSSKLQLREDNFVENESKIVRDNLPGATDQSGKMDERVGEYKFTCRRLSIVICAAFTYAFANGMGMIEQSFLTKYVTISKFSLTSAKGASIEGSSWITHVVCGFLSIFVIQKIGLKRILIVSAVFIAAAHGLLITTFHTGQEWILWAVVNIMAIGTTSVFGVLVAYMETKFRVSPREASIYLIPNCLGNIIWPTFIGAFIDDMPDVFVLSMAFCGFMAVLLVSFVIFFAEKFYPKCRTISQITT